MASAIVTIILVAVNLAVACGAWLGRWQAYDPEWLVHLAQEQHPDEAWLPEALRACTRAQSESSYYIYFVPSHRPNQPGSAWQFERNLTLESEEHGDVVLDILKGNKVGGIEFVSKLIARGT
jgi:hypothetical protein